MHSIPVKCIRVIDGDTFEGEAESTINGLKVTFDDLIKPHVHGLEFEIDDSAAFIQGLKVKMKRQFYRLEGIDAPEMRGESKEAGEASKEFLRNWIEGETVYAAAEEKDKYGRWLARVYHGGLVVNDELVKRGYARYRDY